MTEWNDRVPQLIRAPGRRQPPRLLPGGRPVPEVTGEASDTGGAHRPRVHLKVQSTQVLDAPFQHQRVKSLCHQERTAQCPIHSKDRQGPSPQTEPWTWQAGKGDSLLNSEARSGPAAHSICAPPPRTADPRAPAQLCTWQAAGGSMGLRMGLGAPSTSLGPAFPGLEKDSPFSPQSQQRAGMGS